MFALSQLHGFNAAASGTRLYGWGFNAQYQLGLGDTTTRQTPAYISNKVFIIISAGTMIAAGITTDGSLYLWGNGTTVPTKYGTDTWIHVDCGDEHTLAIKSDGTLWAFGGNANGQIGDGTTTPRASFVQVGSDTTWTKVQGGQQFSIGLKSDGTLWAWGDGADYRLGQGDTTSHSSPIQVGSGTSWTDIAVGASHTLALQTTALYTFGYNSSGQLGIGNSAPNASINSLAGTFTSIGAFGGCSNAIKSDGTLWVWGRNANGQLGLGDTSNRTSPAQLGSATDWTKCCTGSGSCASSYFVNASKEIWVAGENSSYQLGFGDTTQRATLTHLPTAQQWDDLYAGDAFVLATAN